MRCDELRELAPELALGTATGDERADALRHLAGCADCRQEVAQLSEVADELLMLAPVQEPPAGFESRVLERIAPPPKRRGRRLALWIAAPVATALATAAVMLAVFDDDRDLADSYRATLAVANGTYFQAGHLEGPGGVRAGFVFAYHGDPSWVMVVVDPAHRDARYTGELVTTSGRRIPLPGFRLDPATGSWGQVTPRELRGVAAVRLVDRRDGATLEAALRTK
jgi:hypothetical protein